MCEDGITDDFGVEPNGCAAPQVAIVGIHGERRFGASHRRGPAIRRRGHDQAVQVLHAPSTFDEFDRQPVKQFRMRRGRALTAEIKQSRHQRLPHVAGPEMVDGHARRERVTGVGDPLSEGGPPTGTDLRKRNVWIIGGRIAKARGRPPSANQSGP